MELKESDLFSYSCGVYKCNFGLCRKISQDINEAFVHSKKHQFKGKYCCDLCLYSTDFLSILENHKVRHTDYKTFACTSCSYKTSSKKTFDKHNIKHLYPGNNIISDTLKCQYDYCQYQAIDKLDLINHIRQHINRYNGFNNRLNSVVFQLANKHSIPDESSKISVAPVDVTSTGDNGQEFEEILDVLEYQLSDEEFSMTESFEQIVESNALLAETVVAPVECSVKKRGRYKVKRYQYINPYSKNMYVRTNYEEEISDNSDDEDYIDQ